MQLSTLRMFGGESRYAGHNSFARQAFRISEDGKMLAATARAYSLYAWLCSHIACHVPDARESRTRSGRAVAPLSPITIARWFAQLLCWRPRILPSPMWISKGLTYSTAPVTCNTDSAFTNNTAMSVFRPFLDVWIYSKRELISVVCQHKAKQYRKPERAALRHLALPQG